MDIKQALAKFIEVADSMNMKPKAPGVELCRDALAEIERLQELKAPVEWTVMCPHCQKIVFSMVFPKSSV